jgi:hypothetical protein
VIKEILPLLEYIQQRHVWTTSTIQSIDWRAHELALSRRIHRRVHLTKLIHDILPTNDIASNWTPKRTEKCPSCPFTPEDRDHVLRCSHSTHREWRRTFLISIRKTCDQLNIDADAVAGDFQDQHGCNRPHVLMFPHAGTQFQLNQGTITNNYKSSICYAAHGPPLLEYIQQHHVWTTSTVQSIDWHAHELALSCRIHCRVHLMKLIHDILPTNDIASKWTPKHTEKCPSCPFTPEDRNHVLRCPHSTHREWRWTFLISLQKTCDQLNTRPHLQDILLHGLEAWLNNKPANFSCYPNAYSTLLHQQNHKMEPVEHNDWTHPRPP